MKAYQQPQISVWELTEKDVFMQLSTNAFGDNPDAAMPAYIDDAQGSFGNSFSK